MIKINDKEFKQYFKQIKLLMPIYTKKEKKFIVDLRSSVQEYIEKNPNCTYDDLIDHFEEPSEVVHNYISSLDEDQLFKKISLMRTIKRAIVVVVAFAALFFCARTYMFYDVYMEAKNTIITEGVTIIE